MTPAEIKEFEEVMRVLLGEVLEEKFGEHLHKIDTMLEKHGSTLYGNGKPGLITVVDRLDRWVSQAQDTLMSILKWALLAIIGGLITFVIVLASQHGLIKP